MLQLNIEVRACILKWGKKIKIIRMEHSFWG